MIDRDTILGTLRSALEPQEFVRAMWIAGSEAFGAHDQWSDIDLSLETEAGKSSEAFALVERAIETVSPIAIRYVLPEPTWHGHRQRFYRLRDASPFLMIDLLVQELGSTAPRFDEQEIHGTARVIFDRGRFREPPRFDREAHSARLEARRDDLRARTELFADVLVDKELARGHDIDALAFYRSAIVDPLVTALRMKHCPERFDFGARYLDRDLPREVVAELRPFLFVSSGDDLREKLPRAIAWLRRALAEA